MFLKPKKAKKNTAQVVDDVSIYVQIGASMS